MAQAHLDHIPLRLGTTPAGADAVRLGRAPLRASAGMVPGVALCVSITATAWIFERLQAGLLGRTYVEASALAILFGAAVRTA